MEQRQVTKRESVEKFANLMEQVLQEKDPLYRDAYKHMDIISLEHRMIEEMGQYFYTCYRFQPLPTQDQIVRRLVHIANFCMLLADKYQ